MSTLQGEVHAFLAASNDIDPRSKALGIARPAGLSEAVNKAITQRFARRVPFGQR
jgi:hypothetical protein